MKASLRALLTELIDYAGLFPPAQLPLERAVRNYAEYRNGPDAWMLGRFVCPAAKLRELVPGHSPSAQMHQPPPSWSEWLSSLTAFPPLSVVGRGGATANELLANSHQDRDDIATLHRHRPNAAIEGFELRLCRDSVDRERARQMRSAVISLRVPHATVFFEAESGAHWRDIVGALLSDVTGRRMGLKVRCGGASPSSVPSVHDVAFALAACRSARVPLKFTAGLHHPLRHQDAVLGVKAHGFLNVFVAGILCHARSLDALAIQPILADEDIRSFHFKDDALGWKDLQATTDEVTAARKNAVISFGSCSFDEPREDLRALGLLN
jgi:hypothetical protein